MLCGVLANEILGKEGQVERDIGMTNNVGTMYSDSEDLIFNRVISDISVVLRETTISISDSIEWFVGCIGV